MQRRLLAFHAHPDDESSKGSATVARYSDAGVHCVLVCATGGEAGDILNPAMDTPEVKADIAAVRSRELDEAASIIGYHTLIRLGYRDSGMPDTEPNAHPDAFVNAPFDDALGRFVRIIRIERPHVVLGYDEHKRYPHPDHIRVHEIGLAAFDAAADADRFPDAGPPWQVSKLYGSLFSIGRLLALHEAMIDRGMNSPFADWVERMDGSEEPPMEPTARIDGTGLQERARNALRAHRTQIDPEGFWFQVPIDLVEEVYPYDDFVLLRSVKPVAGVEDDLFAGVDVDTDALST